MLDFVRAYDPVVALLVATFVYAGVAAGSNADEIERNEDVSHLWEMRERLSVLGWFAFLAFSQDVLSGWKGSWGSAGYALGSYVLGLGAAACLFGLRFDIRLNTRRGLGKDYIGTDPQTAAADRKARDLGLSGTQYALLKWAGLLLCLGLLGWLRWPR